MPPGAEPGGYPTVLAATHFAKQLLPSRDIRPADLGIVLLGVYVHKPGATGRPGPHGIWDDYLAAGPETWGLRVAALRPSVQAAQNGWGQPTLG